MWPKRSIERSFRKWSDLKRVKRVGICCTIPRSCVAGEDLSCFKDCRETGKRTRNNILEMAVVKSLVILSRMISMH